MFRFLFKLIVLGVIVVAAGVFFLGWDIDRFRGIERPGDVTGTSGATAREKTEKAADATLRAIEDGRLTTKIKAKMALDDSVKAFDLNVDTKDGVVTVTGEVRSDSERQRAVTLARETAGVARVIDQVKVR